VFMMDLTYSLWQTLEKLRAKDCHEQGVLYSKAGESEVQRG